MAIQFITKICVLGDFSVGKTSLIRRFVESRFDDRYLSTMGVWVSRKVIELPSPRPASLTMLIWDTAGSERFSSVVRTYYRGASAALLVCDITRDETVASLTTYAGQFRGVNHGVPLLIIGNKADLAGQRTVADAALDDASATIGAPWVLSSAKTGAGVEHAFQLLGEAIVEWKEREGPEEEPAFP